MFFINRYFDNVRKINKAIKNLEKDIKNAPCKTWKKHTVERKECETRKKSKNQKNQKIKKIKKIKKSKNQKIKKSKNQKIKKNKIDL